MPSEVRLEIVDRLRAGERWRDVAEVVGVSEKSISRTVREAGGLPARWSGRRPSQLSVDDREEIMCGLVAGRSVRSIAAGLGRAVSTVSREVNRNGGRDSYRANQADRSACERARRPKPTKLEQNPALRAFVQAGLDRWLSPEQISATLRIEFPDDEAMRVSHETIYHEVYVQGRGSLRKELAAALRTGRTTRKSQQQVGHRGPKIRDMVMIADRPGEVDDRRIPGHWEGDLIIGKGGKSQIATLVERTTRFVMLVALPDGRDAATVAAALQRQVATLPAQMFKTLTWDQGRELAAHAQFSIDTDIDVYFCDPHSPWQRGSNENTNGLLRQYLPKGTDLSVHSQAVLDEIADELNRRPRKTLDWMTPLEAFNQLALH